MAAPYLPLQARSVKQRAEARQFEAFRRVSPLFADFEIVRVDWGGDPPDVLCIDANGNRIGVELTEWLNQQQMEWSIKRIRLEDSYRDVVRSRDEPQPNNFGLVLMAAREVRLSRRNATAFRSQLYRFISHIDDHWAENLDWNNSFEDFTGYPSLAKHLVSLTVHRQRFGAGIDWIDFRPHGGAYTPEWMQNALLENIAKKIRKYTSPESCERLRQQGLNQFVLLAYYDQAAFHNTPYDAPEFGFADIAASATEMLLQAEHPFSKVFLFNQDEENASIQVWPPRN